MKSFPHDRQILPSAHPGSILLWFIIPVKNLCVCNFKIINPLIYIKLSGWIVFKKNIKKNPLIFGMLFEKIIEKHIFVRKGDIHNA
jgi:hypothetical protein